MVSTVRMLMGKGYSLQFIEAIARWQTREIDDLEEELILLDVNVWLWFGKATNLYETDD